MSGRLRSEVKRTTEALARLQDAIAEFDSAVDPFSKHLYWSRRRYHDLELHGKHRDNQADRVLVESFSEAQRLGFRLTMHAWRHLLEL